MNIILKRCVFRLDTDFFKLAKRIFFAGGVLYIKYIKDAQKSPNIELYYSIIVPKKCAKKAIDRNKQKRIVREVLRRALQDPRTQESLLVFAQQSTKLEVVIYLNKPHSFGSLYEEVMKKIYSNFSQRKL